MDQLALLTTNTLKCHFCRSKSNNCVLYGPKYQLGSIVVHYYCVLLSDKLLQKGRDDEGILGFLLSDIKNELERSMSVICAYCGRGKATISCAAKRCRKHFHLPCGLENGSLHQFIDNFSSFCKIHRPSQKIPIEIMDEASRKNTVCCICFEAVIVWKKDVLWAPCCEKTWYHKNCVQKLALSAGYFFKCAICNDAHKFNNWMQRYGIFIPQQDASWELVPNAFDELLFRYENCDARNCKCPQGRKKNEENTIWEIVLCASCGSQGIHIACGNLKFLEPEWECNSCHEVAQHMKTDEKEAKNSATAVGEGPSEHLKLTEVSQKKRRRSSEELENYVLDKRKKCRINLVEEEEEIDVELVEEEINKETQTEADGNDDDDNDEFIVSESSEECTIKTANIEDVLTSVKPGPLSFKLSLIRRALESSPRCETKRKNPKNVDFVDLTDVD